jgi:hypothetical protein
MKYKNIESRLGELLWSFLFATATPWLSGMPISRLQIEEKKKSESSALLEHLYSELFEESNKRAKLKTNSSLGSVSGLS